MTIAKNNFFIFTIILWKMRTIDKIILHCTATKEGMDFHRQDVDRWHKQRGWKGIGYHYLITLDGTVEVGRKEEEIGAHTVNYNKNSIAIAYVGGLDKDGKPNDTRTTQQKAAMYKLLCDLKKKYPNATIHGHYEFAKKACPCFNVKEDYGNL